MTTDEDDDPPFPKRGTPEWAAESERLRVRLAEQDAERLAEQAAARAAKEAAEKALTPDDIRHRTAVKLLAQLDDMSDLTGRCQRLATRVDADRIAPLHAAAALMNASAHVANALAKVTFTESRQRRIIERVQSPAPKMPYSNATLEASVTNASGDISKQAGGALDSLLFDTLQRKMLLYMNLLAAKTFDKDLKEAYPELYESAAPGEAPAETAPA